MASVRPLWTPTVFITTFARADRRAEVLEVECQGDDHVEWLGWDLGRGG